MKIRRLVLVLAASLLALAGLATTGTAGASVHGHGPASYAAGRAGVRIRIDAPNNICDSNYNNSCLSANGTLGDDVYSKIQSEGADEQAVTFYQQNVCNGGHTVTGNCPFTVGSGLNTEFGGYTIATEDFVDEGTCAGADDSGDVPQVSCSSGNGRLVVLYGDYLVDVYYSDYIGGGSNGTNQCSSANNAATYWAAELAETANCEWYSS